MSTLLYANIISKREKASPGTSMIGSPPGLDTYLDTLAALVPAEVLAVHAVILTFTTKTENEITTISEPKTLFWVFWGLIIISILFYVFPRVISNWNRYDTMRMFISPLAFVGWTMLQSVTAFDAVFPNLAEAPRRAIALGIAICLALITKFLSDKADQNGPINNPV